MKIFHSFHPYSLESLTAYWYIMMGMCLPAGLCAVACRQGITVTIFPHIMTLIFLLKIINILRGETMGKKDNRQPKFVPTGTLSEWLMFVKCR